MELSKLIESIQSFMEEEDRSCSPRFHNLHEEYVRYFNEWEKNFRECARMAREISLSEAKKYNESFSPSLAERFRMLDFPQREEFFGLCCMYGLQIPEGPDKTFIRKLQEKANDQELSLNSLLNTWRKIARSGSNEEKISTLRKIYALEQGVNRERWRKNLAEVEKARHQEIALLLKKIKGVPDELPVLEALNLELASPQWQIMPSEDLLEKLRAHLGPLQQARFDAELEEEFNKVHGYYQMQQMELLEQELSTWENMCKSPMAHLTAEQKEIAYYIKNSYEQYQEEKRKKAAGEALMAQLGHLFENSAKYEQVSPVYNQLKLLDWPIPKELQDRMESLEYEAAELERMRSTRRNLFGVCGTVAVLVILGFSVFFYQRYQEEKGVRNQLLSLVDAKEYDAALGIFQKLEQEKNPLLNNTRLQNLKIQIRKRKEDLENAKKDSQRQFKALCKNIESWLQKDFLENRELDQAFALGEKIPYLTAENKIYLQGLKDRKLNRIAALQERRRNAFDKEVNALIAALDKLPMDHKCSLTVLQMQLKSLDENFSDLVKRTTHVAKDHIGRREKNWKNRLSMWKDSLEKEKKYRTYLKNLTSPGDIIGYFEALEKVASEPDCSELSFRYSKARRESMNWKKEMKALQNSSLPEVSSSIAAELDEFTLDSKVLDKVKEKLNDIHKSGQFSLYRNRFESFSDQRIYTLYSKSKPELERQRNNRALIRFIGIDAVLDLNNTRKEVTFAREMAKERNGAYLLREQGILPAGYYKYLVPVNNDAEKTDAWSCLEKICSYKSSLNGIDYLEKILQLADENIQDNSCHKLIFVKQILQILKGSSLLYSPQLDYLLKAVEGIDINAINWYRPDAAFHYRKEYAQLEEKLHGIDLKGFAGSLRNKLDFCNALKARKLECVGVIIEERKGKFALHTFPAFRGAAIAEYLALNGGKLSLLKSDFKKGIIAPADSRKIYNGMIVWSFMDGITTEKFIRERKSRALSNGGGNLVFTKVPRMCPQELHYLLKVK